MTDLALNTTRADEAFAAALMDGKTRSNAYREVFPERAAKMTVASVHVAASTMNKRPSVQKLISRMREELMDAGVWRKSDSIEVLVDIARNGDRNADKIAAVKELDNILGLNAPAAININTVGTVTINFIGAPLEHLEHQA